MKNGNPLFEKWPKCPTRNKGHSGCQVNKEMEINWYWVREKSDGGQMMEVLEMIPRDKWNVVRSIPGSNSLIWFASRSDKNVRALIALINQGVDVNDTIPLSQASYQRNPKIVEILIASQANVHLRSVLGLSAFDYVFNIRSPPIGSLLDECAKVFISNGVRLKTIHPSLKYRITQELIEFEQGVLRCRDVIITLLGLKKKRRHRNACNLLPKLDRFLIQQVLAVEIWTTRTNETWQ